MTPGNKISVQNAIDILRAGGNLGESTISNLDTSRVKAMDALLLAKNGFIVPDGNIFYDDKDIKYDPDFDEVEWGKPVPFKQVKNSLAAGIPAEEELIVRVRIKDDEMKKWLKTNRKKLDLVINKLLEDLYKTERLLKG